ncbi:MAG TPA: pseudouridylate synthase [Sphingobacterium sp.]|jgi:tRNA pseudouridine65 synthase|uniref:pseudouridine synthase n=1 Tax=Sphingobacterium TaxID=28453 RepID=UPI00097EB35C|nr:MULTISPECIES: pseudouridine synthase [Sphingobacterium]UXD69060.1 pseudouridine synthase [Sphingobacterium faecium]SJN32618.1 tRNA pseudouridine synthase C [Sphingobacterium faecium PCAi_F2.5]HCU44598.1 pseudouridylate synthase [Sphingobacterium sp.]
MLEILYQDEDIIAINKPHGLLVHRSSIARDASEFALQLLRDQIGQPVYPAHRLDRKTAGILLFSLNKETDKELQQLFQNQLVDKRYIAVLRGHAPEEMLIDYPLKKDNGVMQEAQTNFKTIAKAELPFSSGKFPTSRYSLVEANPTTGRMHQLRKHFAHIFHPIIGDRPHGCNKQNKFWKENFEMDTMMLHASEITFKHPKTQNIITIQAGLQPEFQRVLTLLNLEN